MNRWILYSVPGIRGRSALVGQGPHGHCPKCDLLKCHSPEYSPKPVPQLASPCFHFSCYSSQYQLPNKAVCWLSTCRFPVLVLASSIFPVSLASESISLHLHVVNTITDPPWLLSQHTCPNSCAVSYSCPRQTVPWTSQHLFPHPTWFTLILNPSH